MRCRTLFALSLTALFFTKPALADQSSLFIAQQPAKIDAAPIPQTQEHQALVAEYLKESRIEDIILSGVVIGVVEESQKLIEKAKTIAASKGYPVAPACENTVAFNDFMQDLIFTYADREGLKRSFMRNASELFTDDELKQFIAHYRSPDSKKFQNFVINLKNYSRNHQMNESQKNEFVKYTALEGQFSSSPLGQKEARSIRQEDLKASLHPLLEKVRALFKAEPGSQESEQFAQQMHAYKAQCAKELAKQ